MYKCFNREEVVENASIELFRNPYLENRGFMNFILEVGVQTNIVHKSVISIWLPKDCPSGHIEQISETSLRFVNVMKLPPYSTEKVTYEYKEGEKMFGKSAKWHCQNFMNKCDQTIKIEHQFVDMC